MLYFPFFFQQDAMPQYHTAAGTFSYVDEKSAFPRFPKVTFGQAIAIGLGAGFVGGIGWKLPATYVPFSPLTLVPDWLSQIRLSSSSPTVQVPTSPDEQ